MLNDSSRKLNCFELLQLSHISTLNGKIETFILCIGFVFIMVSNSLLLFGLWRTGETKNTTNKFLIALCLGDLFMIGCLTPTHIINANIGEISCDGYSFEQFIGVFLGTSASALTFGMSIDRFIFVKKPFFHQRLVNSTPAAFVFFIIVYTISAALSIFVVILVNFGDISMTSKFNIVSICLLFMFLFSSITVNISLVCYVRQKNKEIQRLSQNRLQQRNQVRTIQTVFIICTVQLLTISPWIISLSYMTFYFSDNDFLEEKDTIYYVHTWLKMPMLLNSGLNAAIFFWRSKKICRYYKNSFNCK